MNLCLYIAHQKEVFGVTRWERSSNMEKTLHSGLLGPLVLQSPVPGCYLYLGTTPTRRHGAVKVVLNTDRGIVTDWRGLLGRAERNFFSLLKAESRLRAEAVSSIQQMRRKYGDPEEDLDWHGTKEELAKCLKLHMVKFSQDGTTEVIYHGGEPAWGHDVILTLGPRLGVRRVGFEG